VGAINRFFEGPVEIIPPHIVDSEDRESGDIVELFAVRLTAAVYLKYDKIEPANDKWDAFIKSIKDYVGQNNPLYIQLSQTDIDKYNAERWFMDDSDDFRTVCDWAGLPSELVRRKALDIIEGRVNCKAHIKSAKYKQNARKKRRKKNDGLANVIGRKMHGITEKEPY
jgi:hypothetical protein